MHARKLLLLLLLLRFSYFCPSLNYPSFCLPSRRRHNFLFLPFFPSFPSCPAASKQIARDADVSTVPGALVEVNSEAELREVATQIGFPVMIKATAGGGGKGMRVAWDANELEEGFRLSKAEAKSSFGNDTMFLEKYIEQPRHIGSMLVLGMPLKLVMLATPVVLLLSRLPRLSLLAFLPLYAHHLAPPSRRTAGVVRCTRQRRLP